MNLISHFSNHVSIKKIKENLLQVILGAYTFSAVSLGDVKNEVLNLDIKKSSLSKLLPATIWK